MYLVEIQCCWDSDIFIFRFFLNYLFIFSLISWNIKLIYFNFANFWKYSSNSWFLLFDCWRWQVDANLNLWIGNNNQSKIQQYMQQLLRLLYIQRLIIYHWKAERSSKDNWWHWIKMRMIYINYKLHEKYVVNYIVLALSSTFIKRLLSSNGLYKSLQI